jgi:hypothetical protein
MAAALALVIAALQAAGPAGGAQAESAPRDCSASVHRQFDFWIGSWDMVPNGAVLKPDQRPSSNVITLVHDGCVLVENWSAATGGTGMSVNIYDRSRGQWHQTWVDSGGGVHEYWGGLEGDRMVFFGTMPVPSTPQLLMRVRLTFFRQGPDTVRQLSERLNADGTWSTNYDLIYTRRK